MLANSRAVNTNLGVLGLDLHSNSPEPLNFFGGTVLAWVAQSLFGGHKQSFGGHGPRMPPWPELSDAKLARELAPEYLLLFDTLCSVLHLLCWHNTILSIQEHNIQW